MSDIGLIMNGLLGVLLIGALAVGWRLERRLKALRASHEGFTRAVGDLDKAAGRAEQGLADLRVATDEAAETLAGRIDRASHLAQRLERLTHQAVSAEARLAAQARSAPPAASEARAPVRETAFARFAERYGAKSAPEAPSPKAAPPEAAARRGIVLGDDEPRAVRLAPEAAARIERLRALARPKPAPAGPAAPPDDELFDAPALRAAGGRR
jgi:hypothetical protein